MKIQKLTRSAALLALLATATPQSQAGDDSCKPVSGPFTSVVVAGEQCASPEGICTRGILTGNFHAIYEFTITQFRPASDEEGETLFVYEGVSVLTLRNGKQMISVDTGFMDLANPTAVPFETTAVIESGDGQYVSGKLVASGTLNFLTGEAVGSYEGEICKEKKNEK